MAAALLPIPSITASEHNTSNNQQTTNNKQPSSPPLYKSTTLITKSQLPMSTSQILTMHAGSCSGHCRAQRFDLDHYCAQSPLRSFKPYYSTEQYEKDKAAINSYEAGAATWDEDEFQGCCTPPPFYSTEQYEKEKAAIKSYEEGAATWDEEEFEGCCSASVEAALKKVQSEGAKTVRPTSKLLWHSETGSCATCGRRGALQHL